MRVLSSLLLLFFSKTFMLAQIFPQLDYPRVFHEVQINGVFADSKIFVDYTPIISAKRIDSCFLAEKQLPGFMLNDFVETYFIAPTNSPANIAFDTSYSIEEHIDQMWNVLYRKPNQSKGCVIGLKYPYLVSDVRSDEFYYWDNYFVLLGLTTFDEKKTIEDLIKNFANLIDRYGFIPHGNRSYYLSRSQPPFFALMLQLVKQTHGNEFAIQFLPQLEKEYNFWMMGKETISEDNPAIKRIVLLQDGTILNRYWDNNNSPRSEAYKEDIETAKKSNLPGSAVYSNIRAACESGWNFSSRWLANNNDFSSIQTCNILPVDLNCLLLTIEETLAEFYLLNLNKKESMYYRKLANKRRKAINKYFWNKDQGFFADYNFVTKSQNSADYLSGMYPLFIKTASNKKAEKSAAYLQNNFLKSGGLVSSLVESGEEWDFPHGLAPLQYISIIGLRNYEYNLIADSISERWIKTNLQSFGKTGRLYDKHNVVYTTKEIIRKENQGRSSWANGVLIKLLNLRQSR